MQDTGDIKRVTLLAPSLPALSLPASSAQVDVWQALQRAAILVKALKTKNASNKNKERTSLAGAIVKLLEKDQPPSDGMAANMSMMLMQQMEAINKSMDKRARRERKEERRERKRCKKRRTKKGKKKRAKKAALEGMEDHVGKTRGGSSSNSSSSSNSGDSSESDSNSSA